ncbi:MAG: hypothetical protein IKN80_03450 [Clostridiales bacterium]|nr:hypothetical protein [Clostridiales bacterium]
MKLTDELFECVRDSWEAALCKPFVRQMADGSLDPARYRNYMIMDYQYLQGYIRLLEKTLKLTEDTEVSSFLRSAVNSSYDELNRVHIPCLLNLGVTGEELSEAKLFPVSAEYIHYMEEQLDTGGAVYGLTALLQCSWAYAYIGERMNGKVDNDSPYRDWFDSYACEEYIYENSKWIDIADKLSSGINEREREALCDIFVRCAEYENRLWDEVYEI